MKVYAVEKLMEGIYPVTQTIFTTYELAKEYIDYNNYSEDFYIIEEYNLRDDMTV